LPAAASKKFDALTGARFIFATLVFLYHNRKYWREQLNHYVLQEINEFHVGVSLFFVLSGFLIAWRYNAPNTTSKFKYWRYALLRLARILPLYWLLLLISYIDWGFPGTEKSLLTFTLLHGLSNLYNLEGIAQAWSLTVELSFYLLAPLIFIYWNQRIYKAIVLLLIWLGLAVAIGYGWHSINGNKASFFYPLSFVIYSTFFGRSIEFAAGIYLAGILHNRHRNPFSKFNNLTLIGSVGLLVSMFAIGFFQPDVFHHGFDVVPGALLQYTLIPAFAITWFYGLITEQTMLSKILSSKVLVLLGNASFAFYLVHISYVNLKLKEYVMLPDKNFILLWCIAIVLFLVFEQPVNEGCRKLLKRKQHLS
jgi:peptidoglycan/LPS O-acetylase OafA/YrhL